MKAINLEILNASSLLKFFVAQNKIDVGKTLNYLSLFQCKALCCLEKNVSIRVLSLGKCLILTIKVIQDLSLKTAKYS